MSAGGNEIAIRCWGGLGNQMFQYALYRELRKRGLDATLDIDYFRHNTLAHGGGGYQLPYVFGINAFL